MLNWTLDALLGELQQSTGKSFRPKTFADRLRIQKTVYLLKALRLPAASAYAFNDYFHGPYSRALAREYYELRAAKDTARPARSDRGRIPPAMLQVVGEGVSRGNRLLETAATLHSLATRNPQHSREALFQHAGQIKPGLRDAFEEAWAFLTMHGLVAART